MNELRPQQWHLVRYQFSDQSTIGKLDLDGVFVCNTLERVADGKNAPNQSAINEGTYPVEERYSPHFGRNVLGLCNVPGRTDIEIHVANKPSQLQGCIGVGMSVGPEPDFIGNSVMALGKVMSMFRAPASLQIESIHLDSEKPEIEPGEMA
jgi:hypothetical protein